jgi:hypothetical protein
MAVTAVQPCLATTVKCLEACEACFVECGTSGDREREKCAALARDCADLAALSLALMSRGSAYADDLCALHARACQACADTCAKFPEHACCVECMAACRACAAECRIRA